MIDICRRKGTRKPRGGRGTWRRDQWFLQEIIGGAPITSSQSRTCDSSSKLSACVPQGPALLLGAWHTAGFGEENKREAKVCFLGFPEASWRHPQSTPPLPVYPSVVAEPARGPVLVCWQIIIPHVAVTSRRLEEAREKEPNPVSGEQ